MLKRVLGLFASVLMAGCLPVVEPPAVTPPASGVTFGPEIRCAEPVSGFAVYEEIGQASGLDHVPDWGGQVEPFWYFGGSIAAVDLDADGDVDLALGNASRGPDLFENDGSGRFTRRTSPLASETDGRPLNGAVGAVDLDGDGLPELAMVGLGSAQVLPALGDWEYGPPAAYQTPQERTLLNSMAFGDVNGDGALDLFLPTVGRFDGQGPEVPVPSVLLLGEADGFGSPSDLTPASGPGLSLAATFTDRDGDGDADLLALSDRPGLAGSPSAFYRNDGVDEAGWPVLVDDAAEVGADLLANGMGIGSADLNGDGALDYCMSDSGLMRCLLSTSDGSYYDGATALGLQPASSYGDVRWTGWSLGLDDLDNDGSVDAWVGASGFPAGQYGSDPMMSPGGVDAIWQGGPDGLFTDRSEDVGFAGDSHHYGGAAADLDGDGFLELVLVGGLERPKIWHRPCGSDGWLEVELIGNPGNRSGIGARVEVAVDDRVLIQELMSVRGLGQGPSSLHFGLGDLDAVAWMRVAWPGGETTLLEDVPTRRRVTVTHPDLLR